MQALERMVREAAALADPASAPAQGLDYPSAAAEAEVARVMQVCNACRYCEGFCAVFPAMTRRLAFSADDAHFLANLCHSCGACLHACQYAPPHDFRINVPQAMARVRGRTYREHAWPRAFGALYERNGLTVALALAGALALLLVLAMAVNGSLWGAVPGSDFYRVLPHNAMVALFAPVFGWTVLALGIGVTRFWRRSPPGPASGPAVAEATKDALTLRYLDGGHGEGCHVEDDAFTHARRHAHHATFYGFLLCFAATSVATLYHYGLGWVAPYDFSSLPKLLGIAGGVLLSVGTASLWRLRRRRHPLHGDADQAGMDLGFIALLFGTAVTGLVLTALRSTAALPLLLAVHLGFVLALFATMPYGKFAHGVYRAAALLKWAIEKRQPSRLSLGGE